MGKIHTCKEDWHCAQCLLLPDYRMSKHYPTLRMDVMSYRAFRCTPAFQLCLFVAPRVFSCKLTTGCTFVLPNINTQYDIKSILKVGWSLCPTLTDNLHILVSITPPDIRRYFTSMKNCKHEVEDVNNTCFSTMYVPAATQSASRESFLGVSKLFQLDYLSTLDRESLYKRKGL